METVTPRVGQDCDPRCAGRTVRIVDIVRRYPDIAGATTKPAPVLHAVVVALTDADATTSSRVGRFTTIRMDRLKPGRAGYRLVKDVEGAA